ALGSKGDRGFIRSGEDFMSVEAVFDISGDNFMQSYFKENGIDGELLIICRTLNKDGKNTINLNGRTLTLSMLREITSRLVDIYSQSEHISLLKPSTHIGLLDGFGLKDCKEKEQLESCYVQYKKIEAELNSSGANDEKQRLAELYAFQIEEIEKTAASEEEEQELIKIKNRLSNIEKISLTAGEASQLFDGEYGLLSIAAKIKSSFAQCSRYDEGILPLTERFESLYLDIDDINNELSDYIFSLEYDGAEAERVDKRLDEIKSLKRKYGGTLEKVQEYLQKIKTEYNEIESSREKADILNKQKTEILRQLYNLSVKVSEIRKRAAKDFEESILSILSDLSMGGCTFKVMFDKLPDFDDTNRHITSGGMDKLEFYISTNKGEPLKPLAKIISGGEMSRFMLAIKSIISDIDDIDTLIFDEIDSGISGFTATAVAKKFAELAKKRQIIAITHLPQIAAMADSSFLIEKREEGGKAFTYINKLDKQGAGKEVSRLIGAADIGEFGKMHAKEMILWSESYKKSLK
ncbi:MAG: DNA repair protein RecN, partial [Clostridia bacterium]|nr:DNA repair protein RecN [Clostridia bacterium]